MGKPIAFLYNNNKHTKKGLMDVLPFNIASKKKKKIARKIARNNLTKEVKNFYNENFKLLKKKIKTLENEKIHAHGLEEL